MQSARKYLLSLVSIVYAIILLHNLTPHAHGALQADKSFGFLSTYFQFLFGEEHHEYQDEDHLSTFRIQEDNEEDSKLEIKLISDFYLLSSSFIPVLIFNAADFAVWQKSRLFGQQDCFESLSQLSQLSGRAPPYIVV
jgi:hypothetical protein